MPVALVGPALVPRVALEDEPLPLGLELVYRGRPAFGEELLQLLPCAVARFELAPVRGVEGLPVGREPLSSDLRSPLEAEDFGTFSGTKLRQLLLINRVGGTSLTGVPSSHTTVRTVRYTAVPNLNT